MGGKLIRGSVLCASGALNHWGYSRHAKFRLGDGPCVGRNRTTPGWSANLTLPNYGRVARYSGTITETPMIGGQLRSIPA